MYTVIGQYTAGWLYLQLIKTPIPDVMHNSVVVDDLSYEVLVLVRKGTSYKYTPVHVISMKCVLCVTDMSDIQERHYAAYA